METNSVFNMHFMVSAIYIATKLGCSGAVIN